MTKNSVNRAILPEPTIRRLPWYLSYVRMLDKLHVDYVSSTQISKELNVQSSQIAKDLSFLNVKGKTRIGYEVKSLVAELEDSLGFSRHHDAVVIGTGSLGTALMQDHGLEHYGLNIVAGFDVRSSGSIWAVYPSMTSMTCPAGNRSIMCPSPSSRCPLTMPRRLPTGLLPAA